MGAREREARLVSEINFPITKPWQGKSKLVAKGNISRDFREDGGGCGSDSMSGLISISFSFFQKIIFGGGGYD